MRIIGGRATETERARKDTGACARGTKPIRRQRVFADFQDGKNVYSALARSREWTFTRTRLRADHAQFCELVFAADFSVSILMKGVQSESQQPRGARQRQRAERWG